MSGLPLWAQAGAKVICVDNALRTYTAIPDDLGQLVVGAEYVIERAWMSVAKCFPIIAVSGVSCTPNAFGRPTGFALDRFRPLIPRKTEAEDVALFKAHLKAQRSTTITREDADA